MTPEELIDFLTKNPEGKKLPGDLTIRGDLKLLNESIARLPDNLIVTGNLRIMGCKNLTRLPANLFVGGDLIVSSTPLQAIPRDLNVRGDIYLDNLELDIPKGFTANGSLDLNADPGKHPMPLRLPDNLTVNGALNISNRLILNHPLNLTVKGCLVLDGTFFGGVNINWLGYDD